MRGQPGLAGVRVGEELVARRIGPGGGGLDEAAGDESPLADLGDAQRIVAMRQVDFGHRHAQVRGLVQLGQGHVVQVAGQQPFAGFRAT